jgi:hypothetical protein
MRALGFVDEVGQERDVCSMTVGVRLCYEFILVVGGRW